jgi:RND superfamily putative drug exporter
LTRFLYALGGFCVRRRVPVLVVWLLIVVALAVLARGVGEQTSDNLVLPGTDSQQATDTLGDHFPEQANGTNPIALAVPKDKKLTDAPYKDAIDGVVKAYRSDPSDPEGGRPALQRRRRADRQEQVDRLHLAVAEGQPERAQRRRGAQDHRRRGPAKAAGVKVAAGGYLGQKVSKPSSHTSEVVGIVAAILILLVTFGSAVAMGLPIGTAIVGLVTGLSIVTLLGQVVEVPTTAPALATMIGLGVGIDYGLFVVSRHRDQLRAGMEISESIARTTATSGGAVLFAGFTVIIALLSLALSGIPLVTTLGTRRRSSWRSRSSPPSR